MIEKFYYLFYKEVKTTRKNDQSFFNAFIGLCFIVYMNLASVFCVVNHFVKHRFGDEATTIGLLCFGIIIAFNYWAIWIKKEAIILHYEKTKVRYGRLMFWFVISLSFTIFYFVLYYLVDLRIPKNELSKLL